MVFCYKLLTESPRRCASVSPRRISSQALDCNTKVSFSALSHLLGNETHEGREILTEEVLDSIPKRDWRLLAALVHKREEQDETERLADKFKKLWSEEKGQKEELEAEMSEQYRRYVRKQREADRRWLEQRRASRCRETQLQRAKLLDVIQYKERKSADLLATLDDRKKESFETPAFGQPPRCPHVLDDVCFVRANY
ncbi:hypothetical protein EVAR_27454_1 [Eumeta japonica]|uniref:Uncharacterized protein n=1 Tax=Eumeta variegata TaxID=151549 RepID=A0A4C1VMG9_EUMVA|nr:hypothetical protein EVAR_27454_1 [Eumeta japonica]